MENHNWTVGGQGYNGSNLAIEGNSAAPFINSLVNGTSSISPNVAYASNYYASGTGVHPSEPNYMWAEAATNFVPNSSAGAVATTAGTINGTVITNDNAPGTTNTFAAGTPHLTQQLNSAGISWQNFQEDYQISSNTVATGGSPLVSKSGTSATVTNPYYNTNQYNYAAKHNPMAFFADTQTQNVNTFDQLRSDISSDTGFGKYNWITPNQYNDQHSSLSTSFTYHSTVYAANTDQEAVAIGDNFLSTIIPQLMTTSAYKNNGAIIIWNDETEGGDSSAYTNMEIVISNLAHPNVNGLPYASNVALNHASDIKTVEELNGLGTFSNPIENTATNTTGGYNTVAGSNDLADLFAPAAVPEPSLVPPLAIVVIGAVGLLKKRLC